MYHFSRRIRFAKREKRFRRNYANEIFHANESVSRARSPGKGGGAKWAVPFSKFIKYNYFYLITKTC